MPLEWNAPEGLFSNPHSLTDVFSTIYEQNVWGQGSGLGSIPEVARPYMLFLQDFLTKQQDSLCRRPGLRGLAILATSTGETARIPESTSSRL